MNAPPVPGFLIEDGPPPPSKPARNNETVILRGISVPLASDVGCALSTQAMWGVHSPATRCGCWDAV